MENPIVNTVKLQVSCNRCGEERWVKASEWYRRDMMAERCSSCKFQVGYTVIDSTIELDHQFPEPDNNEKEEMLVQALFGYANYIGFLEDVPEDVKTDERGLTASEREVVAGVLKKEDEAITNFVRVIAWNSRMLQNRW